MEQNTDLIRSIRNRFNTLQGDMNKKTFTPENDRVNSQPDSLIDPNQQRAGSEYTNHQY